MFKEIITYCGEGVDANSLDQTIKSLQMQLSPKKYLIRKLLPKEVAQGHWRKKTALFVMPGGRDLFYLRDLKKGGATQIRQFVEEGGSYFGICAGGYFASSSIEFEKGTENEIVGDRPLQFFPGKAKGSAYGNNKYAVDSHRGVEAALIHWNEKHCRVYFNGGSFFDRADEYPNVTVLARYASLQGSPASIISCKIGEGRAILSGVHCEYSLPHFLPSNDYLRRVYPFLKKDEPIRRDLFRELLALCLQKSF